MKEKKVSWVEIEDLCKCIKEKCGYKPDIVIGIARGGLVPLRLLSNYFPNAPVGIIGVKRYKEKEGGEARFYGGLSIDVKDKDILLVDDVCDEGITIYEVKNLILSKGAKSICTATLHYKKNGFYKPDIYGKEVDPGIWIKYPWENKKRLEQVVES